MKTDDMEEKLKDLFSRMRTEDEADIPSFESCATPKAAKTISYSPIWRLAASFALVVFLGAGALKLQTCSSRPSQEIHQEDWTSMSSWQAATDNLLTITDTHLDGSFTTDTDQWLEYSDTNGKGNL